MAYPGQSFFCRESHGLADSHDLAGTVTDYRGQTWFSRVSHSLAGEMIVFRESNG
jgi:hypothetical protein